MEDQKELVVDGYRFDRLSDAGEAALEIEKATYFEQRISGRSPENMLAIYDKVLDERIFVTPVGWEYLKFLQARLKEEGIDADRIRPIPLYHTFHFQKVDEQENKGVARERIHPSTKKKMTTADKMRISVIMNVILVLLVAVLFIITLNGENANALNYRKAIQNQYASWEQELTEREKAVKEKEQELQELQAAPVALPDLTGCEVTHKMFGVGKVLPSTDQFLVIDFNGQQKKFSTTTSITSGYLTASDPAVMEQMQDYQAYTKEKDQLEKELKTMKSNLLNMG